jgi:hypothetical protein
MTYLSLVVSHAFRIQGVEKLVQKIKDRIATKNRLMSFAVVNNDDEA